MSDNIMDRAMSFVRRGDIIDAFEVLDAELELHADPGDLVRKHRAFKGWWDNGHFTSQDALVSTYAAARAEDFRPKPCAPCAA